MPHRQQRRKKSFVSLTPAHLLRNVCQRIIGSTRQTGESAQGTNQECGLVSFRQSRWPDFVALSGFCRLRPIFHPLRGCQTGEYKTREY